MRIERFDQLPNAIRESPAFLIHRLHCHSSNRVVHGALKRFKIDFKEYILLVFLFYSPAGRTQTVLARFMCMADSGMSKMLTKLEDRGYVERIRNSKNKREYITTLTERGSAQAQQMEEIARARREYYASIMPPGEYEAFLRTASSFAAVLENKSI